MTPLSDRLRAADPTTDAELVTRYAASRDAAAAAELVRRHGGLVLGTCRRILADRHDADDAFQAVWLVFARRAGAVRPPGMVAGWLYGVAVRTATKAKIMAAKRRARTEASRPRERAEGSATDPELLAALYAELAALPADLRAALLACDLAETPRKRAAEALGWPEGTLAGRLRKGRERLAAGLRKRGFALPAAVSLAVPVPPALADAAVGLLRGSAVPPVVHAMAEAAMRTAKWKVTTIGLTAGLAAAGVLWAGGPPGGVEVAPLIAAAPARPGDWKEAIVLKDHGQMVYAAAFRPDGKAFATAGADGTVIVWDAATLRPTNTFAVVKNLPPPGPDVAPPPQVGPTPPKVVRPGQKPDYRPAGSNPPAIRLHWSAAGLWVGFMTEAGENGCAVYDPATGRPTADGAFRAAHHQSVSNGTHVLNFGNPAAGERRLTVEPLAGGPFVTLDTPKLDPPGGYGGLTAAAFARDGKTIALGELYLNNPDGGGYYEKLRVCDAGTGDTLKLFDLKGNGVIRPGAMAANGKHLAVWRTPGKGPTVWDTATWTAREFATSGPQPREVTAMAFSADGRTLLAAGWTQYETKDRLFNMFVIDRPLARELWAWDVATGGWRSTALTHLHLHPDTVGPDSFAVVPDISQIVESPDGRTRLAVYGSPYRGGVQAAADQARKARNGGVKVWRRAAD